MAVGDTEAAHVDGSGDLARPGIQQDVVRAEVPVADDGVFRLRPRAVEFGQELFTGPPSALLVFA